MDKSQVEFLVGCASGNLEFARDSKSEEHYDHCIDCILTAVEQHNRLLQELIKGNDEVSQSSQVTLKRKFTVMFGGEQYYATHDYGFSDEGCQNITIFKDVSGTHLFKVGGHISDYEILCGVLSAYMIGRGAAKEEMIEKLYGGEG